MGRSGVLGTVSPHGISSISWSPLLESPEDTSTTSGSGCGVKGRGGCLTCSCLVLGKRPRSRSPIGAHLQMFLEIMCP